jgi:hypothetical protein
MKTAIKIAAIGAIFVAVLSLSARHDKALMSIEYCWNSIGDHYVVGDDRCEI